MAKKNNQNNSHGKEEEDAGGSLSEGGKKQKASSVTVAVLKMELHCEGCAGRVVKAVRTLDGVESVRIGDSELNKLTVIGHLDPVALRQRVEEKTKKKVELISPVTKKTKDGDNTTQSGGGGDNKKKQQKPPQPDQQPPPDKPKTAVKKEEKKPKEVVSASQLPVTTTVLKVPLHCQGCVRKIHKIVSKTKGYMEMSIDKNKGSVTVKGAIDVKSLTEDLQHKLKRTVEIVPDKKDSSDGGEKKGKGGGGEKKNKGVSSGGEKKEKGGGGNGGEGNEGGGGKAEAYKMENYGGPIGYPYPQYAYGSGYVDYVHAPQLFSDENANACALM